jgi:hypothetical protein
LVFPVHSGRLEAGIPAVHENSGNQAPVAINRVRPELDIFTKHKIAHDLLCSLANACPFSGASMKASRTLICCLAAVNTLMVSPSLTPIQRVQNRFLRHGWAAESKRASSIPVRQGEDF